MEVGVFQLMPWTEVDKPMGWPFAESMYDPSIGEQLYNQYIDQLVYAEELGYDFAGLNEHHFNAYGLMPSPNIIAGALSQRTSEIDIGIFGNILPIRGNPIRVAEEYAMLDNLLGGRLRAGFVRGAPLEYRAYGVDPDESRPRFEEAWHLIVKSWTETEPFDWHGEFYDFEDVFIWPRPIQQPHPPIWMPAESEESLRWAARHRVPISGIFRSTDEIAKSFYKYREFAEEEFGWNPGDEYFGPARPVYVGETTEQAKKDVKEHAEYLYNKLMGGIFRAAARLSAGETQWREDGALDYREEVAPFAEKFVDWDFERDIENGEFIVGDAEDVTSEIERQFEEMGGFGYFTALPQFGSMPNDMAVKNMERFADSVLPQIDKLSSSSMAFSQQPLPEDNLANQYLLR